MQDREIPLAAMFALLDRLPQATRVSMVRMYRDGLVDQLNQMAQAVRDSDTSSQKQIAHKMAGSAAMMQDPALSLSARAMEVALHAAQTDAALRQWPAIQGSAAATLEALAQAFPAA